MRGVLGELALAERIQVPGMRSRRKALETNPWAAGVFGMSPPDIGHRWNDSRKDANPSDDVV